MKSLLISLLATLLVWFVVTLLGFAWFKDPVGNILSVMQNDKQN